MSDLVLLAGAEAYRRIRQDGFSPDAVSHIAAAAGGPKWLILDRLDRALFGEWFKARRAPITAIGSSIGAWRLAYAAQRDPIAAIARFEVAYLEQRYSMAPGREEISAEARRLLGVLLGDTGVAEVLAHPWLRLNVVVARCRGWLGSANAIAEKAGFLGALLANAVSRDRLGRFVERILLHVTGGAVRLEPDAFVTHHVALNQANLAPALLASASVPGVMMPVRDVPGAPPGSCVDGGFVDYHMDLRLQQPEGIVFLPHFGERVTPGWLDKFVPWRRARYLRHTLIVAPSRTFLARLPNGRIPDRRDFWRYAGDDVARVRDWKIAIAEGQRLADAFVELAAHGRFAATVQRLEPPDR